MMTKLMKHGANSDQRTFHFLCRYSCSPKKASWVLQKMVNSQQIDLDLLYNGESPLHCAVMNSAEKFGTTGMRKRKREREREKEREKEKERKREKREREKRERKIIHVCFFSKKFNQKRIIFNDSNVIKDGCEAERTKCERRYPIDNSCLL